MFWRRTVLFVILGLAASVPWLTAAEPQPGKVRLVHWLKNPDEKLADHGFSTDGRLLIVGSNPDASNYVRVWDPKVGKEIARCSLGKQSAYNIAFAPDGKTVACNYHMAKEICLFDVATGKLFSRIAHPSSVREILEAQFAPDGKTLISRCDPGGLRLWDVKTGKELWRLRLRFPKKMPLPVDEKMGTHYWEANHSLAFSADGKILAVGLADSSVHLCDRATGIEIRRLFRPVSCFWVPSLAFSPDGRYVASHAFEDFPVKEEEFLLPHRLVIRLWEVSSGELVREFKQPIPPISALKNTRASVDREAFDRYRRDSWGLAFSHDGKTLVNCSSATQLWEVATGQLRHEFNANTSKGCFSPDGSLLAACCLALNPDDGKRNERDGIRLWGWRNPCLKKLVNLSPADIERLWSDLASADSAVAYRAIAILLAHPQRVVLALGQRLQRVKPLVAGEVERLISDLNHDSFLVRKRAAERLVALGRMVHPTLLRVKSQRPPLEVRRRVEDILERMALPGGGPETRRRLRAVEVLEAIGTEEARRAIRELASGAAGAVETADAKDALKRLNSK